MSTRPKQPLLLIQTPVRRSGAATMMMPYGRVLLSGHHLLPIEEARSCARGRSLAVKLARSAVALRSVNAATDAPRSGPRLLSPATGHGYRLLAVSDGLPQG